MPTIDVKSILVKKDGTKSIVHLPGNDSTTDEEVPFEHAYAFLYFGTDVPMRVAITDQGRVYWRDRDGATDKTLRVKCSQFVTDQTVSIGLHVGDTIVVTYQRERDGKYTEDDRGVISKITVST